MSLDTKFPHEDTKENLKKLGARHLVTDPFNIEGKEVILNYMVYESPYKRIIIMWKKPIDSELYLLHHEARITHTYPVPIVTKP